MVKYGILLHWLKIKPKRIKGNMLELFLWYFMLGKEAEGRRGKGGGAPGEEAKDGERGQDDCWGERERCASQLRHCLRVCAGALEVAVSLFGCGECTHPADSESAVFQTSLTFDHTATLNDLVFSVRSDRGTQIVPTRCSVITQLHHKLTDMPTSACWFLRCNQCRVPIFFDRKETNTKRQVLCILCQLW
jgi:hypothetical protein